MRGDVSNAAGDDQALQAQVAAVASRLNILIPVITSSMRELLEAEVAELRDRRLVDLLGASIEGNLETMAHMFQHQIQLANLEPPSAALEYSRRLAQQGIPVKELVRAYHLGHDHMLSWCFAEVAQRVSDPVQASRVSRYLVSETFKYIDWISQHVVAIYEGERDEWLMSRNALRSARIRELINGQAMDPQLADQTVGYPLRQQHLALVLWQAHPTPRDDVIARLEQRAALLGSRVGAQAPPLTVAYDRSNIWAWLPLGTSTTVDLAAIRSVAEEDSDPFFVAVSTAGFGYDGFRVAHEEALAAQALVLGRNDTPAPLVVGYGEPGVASASLLAKDLPATRSWVHSVLGPLASDDAGSHRMRETVRIFLEENGSYTSAADRLMMHKNSVKYRIARAKELRGRAFSEDRLDVELALLACHWLGEAVLRRQPATP